jgi:hypothetical protein
MFPQLKQAWPLDVEWPGFPSPQQQYSRALFEERPPLRKLSVVADADLLAAAADLRLAPEILLTGLLQHRYINLLRYRDDGPPPDAKRRP